MLLVGCGFTPLYQQHADSPHLGKIKIGMIEERSGQMLRNLLLQYFAPFASDKQVYKLDAHVEYSLRNLSVQKDATTSRAQVVINVSFTLCHTRSGEVLFRSSESAVADYNILSDSPYSTLVSKQDAHDRLLEMAAQGIRRQVANFLKAYTPEQRQN